MHRLLQKPELWEKKQCNLCFFFGTFLKIILPRGSKSALPSALCLTFSLCWAFSLESLSGTSLLLPAALSTKPFSCRWNTDVIHLIKRSRLRLPIHQSPTSAERSGVTDHSFGSLELQAAVSSHSFFFFYWHPMCALNYILYNILLVCLLSYNHICQWTNIRGCSKIPKPLYHTTTTNVIVLFWILYDRQTQSSTY